MAGKRIGEGNNPEFKKGAPEKERNFPSLRLNDEK